MGSISAACFPSLPTFIQHACSALRCSYATECENASVNSQEFQQRWRAIKTCRDLANHQFEEYCAIAKASPSWTAQVRKKRERYLAFLKCPEYMRKSFSTTNVVEAISGQLEIMRRNSGGYFHSEDTLKFKLGLAVSLLENGKWRWPITPSIRCCLNSTLCFMFYSRARLERIQYNSIDKCRIPG
jgi:hypothetical protein